MKWILGAPLALLLSLASCREEAPLSVVSESSSVVRFAGPSGEPVPGARVRALGRKDRDTAAILAVWVLGSSSTLDRREIPEGTRILVASRQGAAGAGRLESPEGNVEIELVPTATLTGRLVLEPGDLPSLAWVRIDEVGLAVNPGPDGRFRIDSVFSGPWRVTIGTAHRNYSPKDTLLSVSSGSVHDLGDVLLPYGAIRSVRGLQADTIPGRPHVRLQWDTVPGASVYRVWKADASDTGRGRQIGTTTEARWTDNLFPGSEVGEDTRKSVVYRVEPLDDSGNAGRIWSSARVSRASPFLDSIIDPKWVRVALPVLDRHYPLTNISSLAGGFLVSLRGIDDVEYPLTGPFSALHSFWIDSTGKDLRRLPMDSLALGPAVVAYGVAWWMTPSTDQGEIGSVHGLTIEGRRLGPVVVPADSWNPNRIQSRPYPVLLGDTLQVSDTKGLVQANGEAVLVNRTLQYEIGYPNRGEYPASDGWTLLAAADTVFLQPEGGITFGRRLAQLLPPPGDPSPALLLSTDRVEEAIRMGGRWILSSSNWMGWIRPVAGSGVYKILAPFPGYSGVRLANHGDRIAALHNSTLSLGFLPKDSLGAQP